MKQISLRFQAARKARELARRTNDAVAGRDDGQRIASIGRTNRARRFGIAEFGCDLEIAAGFAEGDSAKGVPDALLERSAPHIERDGERLALACEVLRELSFCKAESRIACAFR